MDTNEGQSPRTQVDPEPVSNIATAPLVQPWLHLSDQLTPLIGEGGFCGLFARALRLSAVRFERLAGCAAGRPVSDLLMALTRVLNEIGPEQAGAANADLLATFMKLLGDLIGEALTKQLIDVGMDGGSRQMHERERK